MYIYSVIPLTNIPRSYSQKPDYFSSEKFLIGQLVEVPLASRLVPAIVVRLTPAESQKQTLRKSTYTLKNIKRSLIDKPIFDRDFLKLAEDLADYYFVSVGLMLQRMLLPSFSKPTKPFLKALSCLPAPPPRNLSDKPCQKTLIIDTERGKYYKKLLKNGGNIFLVPKYLDIVWTKKILKNNSFILEKGTTRGEWQNAWIDAYCGNLNTIAGTRSALFMPIQNLENIIIEKENDSSYVSWDQHPKFDARYVAEMMSCAWNTNLTEADSLPSISKWQKAKKENWRIVKKLRKTSGCKIIDMKKELKAGNASIISEDIREKLKSLKKNQQALLFINRRGLSSALLCRDCGYVINCPECDTAMVFHQGKDYNMRCHHCGIGKSAPRLCPNCNSYRIKFLGGGTQRVLQEAQKILPKTKIAILDSDTAPTYKEQKDILENFKKAKYQILIGTQMAIEEKTFRNLELVAVIMADTILSLPSYQSYERTYEILWRLKNMAKNEIVVQTYLPNLSIFKFIQRQDFERFFAEELIKRKNLKWPPFAHIIKLAYSNKESQSAEREAMVMKRKLETVLKLSQFKYLKSKIEILGPAPAFISKIRGKYIWYLLIKWPTEKKGGVKNLKARNQFLNVVPSRYWEVVVDPIDIV